MHLQSWVHGQVLQHFDPQAVELFQSHGYESASSKKVMRASVLVSDMLCECSGHSHAIH